MISPCVGICSIRGGVCRGCGRTPEQIQGWQGYTDFEREEIMGDKTRAIREYARARADLQGAELAESIAKQDIDEALSVLDDRLRDAMHDILKEFEGEYGFQPAEIDIEMLDTTCVNSQWNDYSLGMVNSKY